LDDLGRRLGTLMRSLTTGRTVRGISHAYIERTPHTGVTRHPTRPLVELDPLERLAHLERATDEPPRRGVADAVQVHVAFGIDDAAVQLIDLRHVKRQRLQARPLGGEELAATGMELVGVCRVPLLGRL